MGTRKSYSIPMGMVFGKFYCHKCGEKLKNVPILDRTVHPGDPDWLKESKIGNTHYLGSVEKYEYQFKCPSCGHEMDYHTQCTYKQIQKILGKKVLGEQEIKDYLPAAKAAEEKKQMVTEIVIFSAIGVVAVLTIVLYLLFGRG